MNNVKLNKEEPHKMIQQWLSALHVECPLRLPVITGMGVERHNFPPAWGLKRSAKHLQNCNIKPTCFTADGLIHHLLATWHRSTGWTLWEYLPVNQTQGEDKRGLKMIILCGACARKNCIFNTTFTSAVQQMFHVGINIWKNPQRKAGFWQNVIVRVCARAQCLKNSSLTSKDGAKFK